MISQTLLSVKDMRLSWSPQAGGGLPAAVLGYWVQALLSECQQTLPSSKLMVRQGELTRTLQYILSLSLLTPATQQSWNSNPIAERQKLSSPSPHTSFCCCPSGRQPTARLREQAEGPREASQCPHCSWRSPGVVAVGSRLGTARLGWVGQLSVTALSVACHLG